MFLLDKTKHASVFEEYINESDCDLNRVFEMKQSEIENLVTLTSLRGVNKTSISLRKKKIGMWRFDKFTSVEGRFNPINRSVEPWRTRLRSNFTELDGKIAYFIINK